MKKVYLLLTVALLSSAIVNAQLARSTKNVGKRNLSAANVARHATPAHTQTPASSVIWSDDFSNAANWTISHTTGTSGDWTIGSIGPSGAFPIAPINTTGDFALFDSDLLCGHDQIADLTNATAINLTGHSAVRLTFSEYYRRFHDSTYIYVSNNGTAWTRFEVHAGLISNSYGDGSTSGSLNPDQINLDISSVAANQASVYIRFEFFSPDTNAAGYDSLSGCGYSWMIDDVMLSDIAATDASLMPADAGEYTWIPIIQPEAFQLRGRLINTGSTAITGGQILFNIYDMNGILETDTSAAAGTLNPGDTSAYLMAPNVFVPATIDLYQVEQIVLVSGDGDATNDTSVANIFVNDSTYARDLASLGSGTLIGAYGFNGATGSFAQMYHIWHASDFTSANLYLANPTVGDHISVEIWSVTGGVPDVAMGSSGSYTLDIPDTGWITLAFTAPISVPAGDYAVVLNQLDTTNISLAVGSAVYTPQKNFFKGATGTWTPLEVGGVMGALLLQGNNPSGTLLSAPSLSDKSQISIYPNPNSGYFYIKGNQEKNVTVEVTNSVGQIVKSVKFDSLTLNRIDLHNQPSGMYTVRIKSQAGLDVRSIVIE